MTLIAQQVGPLLIQDDSGTRQLTLSDVTGPPGPQGPAGAGLPPAGSTGAVLAKNSGADYDTTWQTLPADGSAGTASLRTLGTGAAQACSGADARLSDTRTPTDATVTNAKVAGGAAIARAKLDFGAGLVDSDIAAAAAIALSKLATNPLARANHTGTQLASTISDFDTQVRTSRLDQMAAPTTDLSLASHKLINVTDPGSAQDAATKNYVDTRRLDQAAAPTADVSLASHKLTNVTDPTLAQDAATKNYVDGRRLDQAAAPTADVSLNTHKLTNVVDPGSAQDAATKNYVDGRRLDQAGAPTADVSLNSHKLTNVTDPASAQDAATKNYVDGKTKTYRTIQTFAIQGAVTAITLPGFFISLATGQSVKLAKCRYKIGGGTSVSFRLQRNGADITGFGTSGSPLSATTTAATTDPTDVALSDDDLITLVISAVSGAPTDLAVTVALEHTV